jgi:hypothetical protein
VQSNLSEYKAAGVKQVEWIATDPCPICAQNAGARVPIGSTFPSGAEAPPAHPNCICDVKPISEFDVNPISQGRVLNDGDYVSKPDINDISADSPWNREYWKMRDQGGTNGLDSLASVYDRYGYHDKPLVSMSEFERLKDAGQPVVYRGVEDAQTLRGKLILKAEQIQERFKSGPTHWAGKGVYGNGTYSTTKFSTAERYAGGSKKDILEMVIRPEAKIVKEADLIAEVEEKIGLLEQARFDEIKALKARVKNGEVEAYMEFNLKEEIMEKYYTLIAPYTDTSAYAVSRGYDIVQAIPENTIDEYYYIILNRSAVVVNG